MKYGLEDADFLQLENTLILPLQKLGARVWIFGSRARGDNKPFSDIDVLYELPERTQLPAGFLASIHEAFEESSLPVKVDVVNWSELVDSYRESVLRDRCLMG